MRVIKNLHKNKFKTERKGLIIFIAFIIRSFLLFYTNGYNLFIITFDF